MKKLKYPALLVGLVWLATQVAAAGLLIGPQNREKMRENLSTLRLLRMTQALDLSEDQTAKIYPAVNRIEKEKLQMQKQMGDQIEDLRALLKQESPEQSLMAGKIKTIKDLRAGIRAKDEEIEDCLNANLTVLQKAKYVLFSIDFYRSLGEKIRRDRRLR
jgi:Spy/CpxP family protein refolding chaperone